MSYYDGKYRYVYFGVADGDTMGAALSLIGIQLSRHTKDLVMVLAGLRYFVHITC
jgi:hypothetical protein